MYATRPTHQTFPTRRARPTAKSRPQSHPHRALAIETSFKLGVNVTLSIAAIATLVQLVPHRASQETKLQELHQAVDSAKDRLNRTQANFTQYFDPYSSRTLMQEQTNRIEPNHKQVVLQVPDSGATPSAAPNSTATGY